MTAHEQATEQMMVDKSGLEPGARVMTDEQIVETDAQRRLEVIVLQQRRDKLEDQVRARLAALCIEKGMEPPGDAKHTEQVKAIFTEQLHKQRAERLARTAALEDFFAQFPEERKWVVVEDAQGNRHNPGRPAWKKGKR